MRRSPRPTTCSQSNWLPKARIPRMCVTLFASHPSVSIETETTQRTCSPGCPGLPTVATTRRKSSAASCLFFFGSSLSASASSLVSIRIVRFTSGVFENRSGKIAPLPYTVVVLRLPDFVGFGASPFPFSASPSPSTSATSASVTVSVSVSPLIFRWKTSAISVLSQTRISTGGTCSCPGVAACICSNRSFHLKPLLPLRSDLQERSFGFAVNNLRLGPFRLAGQPLPRFQVLRDRLPQLEILRIGPARRIHHRQARNLHNAALNGIHQTEVAHDPRERPALWVPAALQIKRRRR